MIPVRAGVGRHVPLGRAAGLALALAAGAASVRAAPDLVVPDSPSKDGQYELSWSLEAGDEAGGGPGAPVTFVLQVSKDGSFEDPRVVYRGREAKAAISDKEDGYHHYRVATAPGEEAPPNADSWSDVGHVHVARPSRSEAGFYQVSWAELWEERAFEVGERDDGRPTFVLQESQDPGFAAPRVVYRGSDTGRAFSGEAEDGRYYYRVAAVPGEGGLPDASAWREVAEVEVAHHSLAKAFAFLAIGALVFLSTAVLIIAGHRAHRRELARGAI